MNYRNFDRFASVTVYLFFNLFLTLLLITVLAGNEWGTLCTAALIILVVINGILTTIANRKYKRKLEYDVFRKSNEEEKKIFDYVFMKNIYLLLAPIIISPAILFYLCSPMLKDSPDPLMTFFVVQMIFSFNFTAIYVFICNIYTSKKYENNI